METANLMRVNAHSGSYGGQSSLSQDRQQQRRQKVWALFEAVESGNLDASKLAFKALVNFDRSLANDAHFSRLSKAIESGSVYVSQQIVREIKTKLINAGPIAVRPSHAMPAQRPPSSDGEHLIDMRA